MLKPRLVHFLVLSIIWTVTSCSNIDVSTEDFAGDLTRYQTFAWIDPYDHLVKASEAPSVTLDRFLQQDVTQKLIAKGYHHVPAAQADMLIDYHHGRSKILTTGSGLKESRPSVIDEFNIPVETSPDSGDIYLSLEFSDARTKKLIWQGVASKPVEYENPGSAFASHVLLEVTEKLLADYPNLK